MKIGAVRLDVHGNENNVIDFNNILESAKNIKLTDSNLDLLDYVKERYEELIILYNTLEDKDNFNEVTRLNELLYLHSMELGDEYFSSIADTFYEKTKEKDSIKYISNLVMEKDIKDILNRKYTLNKNNIKTKKSIKNFVPNSIKFITANTHKGNDLNEYDIKNLHNILLEGTSLKENNKEYRDKDTYYVGYQIDDETKHVDYFPPLAKDVGNYMNDILEYANDPCLLKEPNKSSEYLFVNPLVTQALVTILQPFPDGNSRTARVINSAYTLKHTNTHYDMDLRYPLMYLSRSYYPLRLKYRENIKEIALDPSNDNWNRWIKFSLFAIEEYIDYTEKLINDSNLTNALKEKVYEK